MMYFPKHLYPNWRCLPESQVPLERTGWMYSEHEGLLGNTRQKIASNSDEEVRQWASFAIFLPSC